LRCMNKLKIVLGLVFVNAFMLQWAILSPCGYETTCLKGFSRSRENLSHKISLIYTAIQLTEGDFEKPIPIPWNVYYDLYTEAPMWEAFRKCGLKFTPVRFSSEFEKYVVPSEASRANKRVLDVYKCFPGGFNDEILFVGRGHNKRRRIHDEAGFVEALRKRLGRKIKYVPGNMGDYSLYEQAMMFHRAPVIISIHGAQLGFITFGNSKQIVIELTPCRPEARTVDNPSLYWPWVQTDEPTLCWPWQSKVHCAIEKWYHIKAFGERSEKSIRYPRDIIIQWDETMLNDIYNALHEEAFV